VNFVVGYAGNGILSIFIAQPEVNFADDDAAPVHQFDLAVACFDLRHGIARIRIFETVQVAVRDRAIPGIGPAPAAGEHSTQTMATNCRTRLQCRWVTEVWVPMLS